LKKDKMRSNFIRGTRRNYGGTDCNCCRNQTEPWACSGRRNDVVSSKRSSASLIL